MEDYLQETELLDFSNPSIQKLIEQRRWRELESSERLGAVYDFVRDEILFGYNRTDALPASRVLDEGYGQCNTKGILFMALLRALGIPNRLHGSTVNKALQKGILSGIWYLLAPGDIVHTWVEVYINNQWYSLEGVIIDRAYLSKLQEINKDCKNTFCGFGVYTDDFANPPIHWDFNHTYIQNKGVSRDFGTFARPDDFFSNHRQRIRTFKEFTFKHLVRHLMNQKVRKIQNKKPE